MRGMDWRPGEGLGPKKQGRPEPIPDSVGQSDRAGLGLRTTTKNRKSKKDDTIAIWRPNGVIYGKRRGTCLHVHSLDIKGRLVPSEDRIYFQESEVRKVARWKGNVLGIAESTFPLPHEWRLEDINKPLDQIVVKDVTAALTRINATIPSCIKKWTEIFGELNFNGISQRYSTGIQTPKDFGSHFKLIMHRAFFTNPHNPKVGTDKCRLCGSCRESIAHFGECKCLKPAFELMRKFDKGERWDDPVLNLFGQHKNKGIIPLGVSLVHFTIWKFILIHMTQLSIEKKPFVCTNVIEQAKKRVKRKIEIAQDNLKAIHITARAKGTTPRAQQYTKWTLGICTVQEDTLIHSDELTEWLSE